jgi:hypothetical protein
MEWMLDYYNDKTHVAGASSRIKYLVHIYGWTR